MTTKKTKRTVTYIEDGQHGWLSVPIDDLLTLGIADKVSSCSYMTPSRIYLEEDCDAGLWLDASAIAGWDVTIRNTYQERTKIRGYAAYDPCWVYNPVGVGSKVIYQFRGYILKDGYNPNCYYLTNERGVALVKSSKENILRCISKP